jgi:hypothetical protein
LPAFVVEDVGGLRTRQRVVGAEPACVAQEGDYALLVHAGAGIPAVKTLVAAEHEQSKRFPALGQMCMELDRIGDRKSINGKLIIVESAVSLVLSPHTLNARPAFGFVFGLKEPAFAFSGDSRITTKTGFP